MCRMSLLFFASIVAAIAVGTLLWWQDSRGCAHRLEKDTNSRWIEVDQKKNRPPLMLLEVVSRCAACKAKVKSWFTEDQCQAYGIPTPPRASSSTN